jgi:hypothetical protein
VKIPFLGQLADREAFAWKDVGKECFGFKKSLINMRLAFGRDTHGMKLIQ